MTTHDRFLTSAAFGLMGGMMAVFAVLALAQTPGCKGASGRDGFDPMADIDDADRSVAKIPGRLDLIDEHADAIERRVPKKSLLDIIRDLTGIKAQTTAVREDAADATADLAGARSETSGLRKTVAERDARIAKLEAENKSTLRKAVGGAVGIGIIGLALSAAVFFGGYTKIARMGGAFSAVLALAGVLIGWYSIWLMLAIVLPLGIGLSVFVIQRLRNESWATYRTTGVIEALKQKLPAEDRAEFFGVGADPGTITSVDAKLGVPQGAKELTAVARETLPALATPMAVATPVVMVDTAPKKKAKR